MSTRCRLLELPPELRNRIWGLIVANQTLYAHKFSNPDQIVFPPLLQVCCQVRTEAGSLHFGSTRFVIYLPPHTQYQASAYRFFQAIDDRAARCIRRMVVRSPIGDSGTGMRAGYLNLCIDLEKNAEAEVVFEQGLDFPKSKTEESEENVRDDVESAKELLYAAISDARLDTTEGGMGGEGWLRLVAGFVPIAEASWKRHGGGITGRAVRQR